MPFGKPVPSFDQLKKNRRGDPHVALEAIRYFGVDAIEILRNEMDLHPIAFKGDGEKTYQVATMKGSVTPFSRAINSDLLISDPEEFADCWNYFVEKLDACAGTSVLAGLTSSQLNRLTYTALVCYGAFCDLVGPGSPGTYLEMIVGPIVSILTGRSEGSAITLPVAETDEVETVTTDLSFVGEPGDVVLVMPTKISTRERISQAYVHQLILDRAKATTGITYRSVLVIANENNTMFKKGTARTLESCWTQETLVPGTIILYHKYVSQLMGLYYLDPPNRYVMGAPATFPAVRTFGDLLTEDLPGLLEHPID